MVIIFNHFVFHTDDSCIFLPRDRHDTPDGETLRDDTPFSRWGDGGVIQISDVHVALRIGGTDEHLPMTMQTEPIGARTNMNAHRRPASSFYRSLLCSRYT